MRNKGFPGSSSQMPQDNIDKGGRRKPNMNDFISKMPDDVLVMILSCMSIKHAAVTSSLSKRWRFVWRNLTQLNFYGIKSSERHKYINQVNGVISGYNHPRLEVFQICVDLDSSYSGDVDEWIQFALDKKVEKLLLILTEKRDNQAEHYEFRLPLSNAMPVEMLFLRDIFLSGVNLYEHSLSKILKNSPHLVKFHMYDSYLSTHVHVGGQEINLKHLTLVGCSGCESISFYNFGLVSFIYGGDEIEFHFTDLPNFKKLDIGEVSVGLENNVFRQISSCAAYLEVLILVLWSADKGLDVNGIIRLPNVKKLMLVMGAEEDDCLLEYTSIAQACPSLETFSISLHWCSPMISGREVRHIAAPKVHKHLKILELIGYYGRISDLELAVYAIDNATALDKIVIDPCCHASDVDFTREEFLEKEQAARSSAQCQITPLLPPGVDLVIR